HRATRRRRARAGDRRFRRNGRRREPRAARQARGAGCARAAQGPEVTGIEAPFALPWIVLAAVWVCLAPLAFWIVLLARPCLARIEPAQRAALVLALCLLPMIGAALVAVLAFAPRIGGLLVDHHCHANVGCTAHVPILHTTIAHAELLAAALVIVTGAAL